jgi:hypothetical protein
MISESDSTNRQSSAMDNGWYFAQRTAAIRRRGFREEGTSSPGIKISETLKCPRMLGP